MKSGLTRTVAELTAAFGGISPALSTLRTSLQALTMSLPMREQKNGPSQAELLEEWDLTCAEELEPDFLAHVAAEFLSG